MIPTGQTAVILAVAGEWLDFLFYGTCLVVALLAAALVIEVVRRWIHKEPESPSSSDQLAQYRSLYKRGEISQEEFDRLRAVLGGEILSAARRPPAPTQSAQSAQSAPAPQQPNGQPPSAAGPPPE